jgi:hypothetical protein
MQLRPIHSLAVLETVRIGIEVSVVGLDTDARAPLGARGFLGQQHDFDPCVLRLS